MWGEKLNSKQIKAQLKAETKLLCFLDSLNSVLCALFLLFDLWGKYSESVKFYTIPICTEDIILEKKTGDTPVTLRLGQMSKADIFHTLTLFVFFSRSSLV